MLTKPSTRLTTVAGQLKVAGQFQATLKHKNTSANIPVFVTEGQNDNLKCNLLRREGAVKLRIIKIIGTVQEECVFGFGFWQIEPVCLKLKEGAKLHVIVAARTAPIPLRKAVQKTLTDLEEQGVIRKVTEPTEWCAPMVPVTKPKKSPKEPSTVRMCG